MRAILLVLAAGVAVAACDRDPATVAFSPPANLALGSAPIACDFPTLRQAARAFFVRGDEAFAIITDLEQLWRPGGNPAADNKAYDGMGRVAAARGTASQRGSSTSGEAVVKGFIGCTSSTNYPTDLDSLDVAIAHGLIEVRGGPNDPTGPALAADASPGQRTPVDPLWGAEATPWTATLPQRMLLFGYARPVSSFTTEPPITNQGTPYTGWELSSFPAHPVFSPTAPLNSGICLDPSLFTLPRLLHNAQPSSSILGLVGLSFCPTTTGILALGGVGGSLSGLSPSGAVLVTPANDGLTFSQQPSDGFVYQPITPAVQVLATTDLGTPVGGVGIQLTVQPGGRTYRAVTKSDGTATFANIRFGIPGTYTLLAEGTLGGLPVTSVTSNAFKIIG